MILRWVIKMVSSDEISSRLEVKRAGQDLYSPKSRAADTGEGLLVCEQCGSYYELQKGESPQDFSLECGCGGKLIYNDYLDLIEKETPQSKTSPNSIMLMVILGMGFVFIFLLFILPFISTFYMILSSISSDGNILGLFVMLILIFALIFSASFTAYYLIKVIFKANQ
jgi:hypothetical protein